MPPSSARDASRSMGVRLLPLPRPGGVRPENANVSNLPGRTHADRRDFKNGTRRITVPTSFRTRNGRSDSCRRPTPKSARRISTSRRTS